MKAFAALIRPARARLAILGVLAAAAYSGAASRGASLLWVVAALLVSTLATGVAWPHWLVRPLSVQRTGPRSAGEGDEVVLRVEVRNRGLLSRFMIELNDRVPFVGAATGTATSGDRILGVLTRIRAGGRATYAVPLACEKRGCYDLGPVSLASSFPLGLAEARREAPDSVREFLIYPEVFPIVALPLPGASAEIHRGTLLLPEAGGAAEFSGLREYRRGDNPRHVHWPTSARLNTLMVREFEPLANAALWLALDLLPGANLGVGRHSTVEYALRIAASVAQHACAAGIPVGASGAGARPFDIPQGTGDRQYTVLLEAFARADSADGRAYAELLQARATHCRRGDTVVVFLSGEARTLPATLAALASLRAGGVHILAIWFERRSFASPRFAASGTPEIPGALLDLAWRCIPVHNGDDLLALFNP